MSKSVNDTSSVTNIKSAIQNLNVLINKKLYQNNYRQKLFQWI